VTFPPVKFNFSAHYFPIEKLAEMESPETGEGVFQEYIYIQA
jgi:hypothetical protein